MSVTENIDQHFRTTEPTADGRERCHADGYLWPCPTVRMAPEALLPGGDVLADEVGVGWAIFRRRSPGAEYAPEGGLVVDVSEEDAPADLTDEDRDALDDLSDVLALGRVRVFRVLSFAAGSPLVVELRSGDFDPLLSNLPNAHSMRTHARKLFEYLSKRKGSVTPSELTFAEYALRLYRQIG